MRSIARRVPSRTSVQRATILVSQRTRPEVSAPVATANPSFTLDETTFTTTRRAMTGSYPPTCTVQSPRSCQHLSQQVLRDLSQWVLRYVSQQLLGLVLREQFQINDNLLVDF